MEAGPMAYPDGISVTSVQFNLSNNPIVEEMAQFDLTWRTASGDWPADVDVYLQNLGQSLWFGWQENADPSWWRGSVALAQIKARALLPNGNTKAEQVVIGDTPWVGTATSASLPWQNAFCVGLYAYEPNTFTVDGRNKRGRFYLPPFCVNRIDTANTGGLSDATVTAVLEAMQAMIAHTVDTMADFIPTEVQVLSRKLQTPFRATWLRADGVIDTQRRRVRQEPKSVSKLEGGWH
jgi:hypothetical protein